jgi:hypothetical protein
MIKYNIRNKDMNLKIYFGRKKQFFNFYQNDTIINTTTKKLRPFIYSGGAKHINLHLYSSIYKKNNKMYVCLYNLKIIAQQNILIIAGKYYNNITIDDRYKNPHNYPITIIKPLYPSIRYALIDKTQPQQSQQPQQTDSELMKISRLISIIKENIIKIIDIKNFYAIKDLRDKLYPSVSQYLNIDFREFNYPTPINCINNFIYILIFINLILNYLEGNFNRIGFVELQLDQIITATNALSKIRYNPNTDINKSLPQTFNNYNPVTLGLKVIRENNDMTYMELINKLLDKILNMTLIKSSQSLQSLQSYYDIRPIELLA